MGPITSTAYLFILFTYSIAWSRKALSLLFLKEKELFRHTDSPEIVSIKCSMVLACKYCNYKKGELFQVQSTHFLTSKVTSKSRAIVVFHFSSDAHREHAAFAREPSCGSLERVHVLGALAPPNEPTLLPLCSQRAQHAGQGNHLRTRFYCEALSFPCISLNKISHYTWWISSSRSSSASLDLHEFILSGEIKRQFIQLLALLGVPIIQPCRSVSMAWL